MQTIPETLASSGWWRGTGDTLEHGRSDRYLSLDLCESKCLKNLLEHYRWFVVAYFPLVRSKYLVIFFLFLLGKES